MLCLKFFDTFSVAIDGNNITKFRSQKVKALLAYLAIEAGRVHQRDSLIHLLWSDQAPKQANNNFRQTLSRLQKVIDNKAAFPPFLVITQHTVQWNLNSNYWLDVDTFLQATDNVLVLDDLVEAYSQLEVAYDLYQGDLLASFSVSNAPIFENWVATTHEQLHQELLKATIHVAESAEAVGQYSRVISLSQRQLALTPWSEFAHRRLMYALAATGQRAESIAQFDRCVEALERELDVAPSNETTTLHQQIVDDKFLPSFPDAIPDVLSIRFNTEKDSSQQAYPYHQIPSRAAHFIGRAEEIAEITARLWDPESRLVTLTGPGGVGKTSLALEVASAVGSRWRNGAAFVPVAAIDSPMLLAPAILQALGLIPLADIDPVDHLLAYLKLLDILLVLDNYEQLLPSQTVDFQPLSDQKLLMDILDQAPQVTLFITSRVRLNLVQEWVYSVNGMALPPVSGDQMLASTVPDLAQFEQSNAVALFVRRAQQVHSSFILAPENVHIVAQICHTLGGLPLGIELAAAWVRILSCQEIYTEIQQSLDFLTTSSAHIPERHRSLQAVFDSSWQRLSPGAQEVVQRLSIFRSYCDRHAATEVANASLTVLAELIDHSFVRRAGTRQYEMHELMRQLAADKLVMNIHLQKETQRTHGLYFARYLEERAERLNGSDAVRYLLEIDERFGDICLAWAYIVQEKQFDRVCSILEVLYVYCRIRGKILQGIELLENALDALNAARRRMGKMILLQAQLMSRLSIFYCAIGKQDKAHLLADQALALAESQLSMTNDQTMAISPESTVAFCLGSLLYIPSAVHEIKQVDAFYTRSIVLYEKCDDRSGIAAMHNRRGVIAHNRGELIQAREFYQMSYEIARQLDDYQLLSICLLNLGKISEEVGRYGDGLAYLEKSLNYYQALNDNEGVAYVLRNMARILLHQGKLRDALNLGHKALDIFQSILYQHGITFSCRLLGETYYLQKDIKKAIIYLKQGETVCNTFGYKLEGAEIATTEGIIALYQGKVVQAERFAEQALDLAQQARSRSTEGPLLTLPLP